MSPALAGCVMGGVCWSVEWGRRCCCPEGAVPEMLVGKEVNLLWRLSLLCQERRVTQSPRPCPSPRPCVPSRAEWGGCYARSCLCSQAKAQALNWLPSHSGTAPQPSQDSSCCRAPHLSVATLLCLGTATLGCGMSLVCPCRGHYWPAPALPQGLQSPAAALPGCSSPSLSFGIVGQLVSGHSTLELFLCSAPC